MSSRILALLLGLGLGVTACAKKKDKPLARKARKASPDATIDDGETKVTVSPDGSAAKMSAVVPDGIEFGIARTALARPKMGDRFYVSSVFLQIFGPEAAPVVIPMIRNNMAAFGAPCDQIGRPETNNCAGRLSFSQLSMVPVSMATREGYRIRTCESLIFNDALLKFAVGQLEGASVLDPPSAGATDKVYEQFYPGQQPTTGVHDALMDVVRKASEGKASLDGWRFLYMTVCSSPDWQLM